MEDDVDQRLRRVEEAEELQIQHRRREGQDELRREGQVGLPPLDEPHRHHRKAGDPERQLNGQLAERSVRRGTGREWKRLRQCQQHNAADGCRHRQAQRERGAPGGAGNRGATQGVRWRQGEAPVGWTAGQAIDLHAELTRIGGGHERRGACDGQHQARLGADRRRHLDLFVVVRGGASRQRDAVGGDVHDRLPGGLAAATANQQQAGPWRAPGQAAEPEVGSPRGPGERALAGVLRRVDTRHDPARQLTIHLQRERRAVRVDHHQASDRRECTSRRDGGDAEDRSVHSVTLPQAARLQPRDRGSPTAGRASAATAAGRASRGQQQAAVDRDPHRDHDGDDRRHHAAGAVDAPHPGGDSIANADR